MTLTFNVSAQVADALAAIDSIPSQVAFATALAVTTTAKQAAAEVTRRIPLIFHDPVPWIQNAIGFTMATKANPTSTVYIKDQQARILALQITGGVRYPAHTALVLPVNAAMLDTYGNVPRTMVARLLAKPNFFSGTVHGTPGIWQRIGHEVALALAYEPRGIYKPIFDFQGIVLRVVDANIVDNVENAMARAIATM